MESCGWNIARGWKRMKYRDLDNIGSDADDEGWLFWHIVSFIVFFFFCPDLSHLFLSLSVCFTNLTPGTSLIDSYRDYDLRLKEGAFLMLYFCFRDYQRSKLRDPPPRQ